ncbi:MAG: hypothetical protein ACLRX1_02980 [Ruminococcus sp.]
MAISVATEITINRIICNQIFSGTKIETIAETTAPKTNHMTQADKLHPQ